jgi:eukaryotic-like serine/threonine-protein kinase
MEGILLDGRYRIGALIGSGGMSVVHQAEDLRLSRKIAIKLIEGTSSDALVERLFREARAAARANHPAVVTVFAYGTDAATGVHYLAMERLEGEDLAARIARDQPLPLEFVLRLGAEIADALAAVHAAGVVHRDLKPSNVFLAKRGLRVDDVKLLDFGVAKQLDMQTLTTPGQVIGTLAYMAPEQLIDAKKVDPRSDLYALGALLFECLSGEPPFKGSSITEITSKILYDEPERLSGRRSDLPPAVLGIIERCMSRRMRDRYATALQLQKALLDAGVLTD